MSQVEGKPAGGVRACKGTEARGGQCDQSPVSMEGHAGGEGAGRREPHGGLDVFFPVRCATTGGQVRVRRLPSPPCVAPGVGSRDASCRGSSRVGRDAEKEKALDVVRSHTGWDLGTLGPAVELGWPGTAARSCVASFLVTCAVCWVAMKARRDQAARGSGTAGAGVGPGGELQLPLEEPLPTWAPASLGLAPRVLPWAWRPECRRPGAQFCARGHGGPPPCPAAACPIGSSWKGVAQSPTVR